MRPDTPSPSPVFRERSSAQATTRSRSPVPDPQVRERWRLAACRPAGPPRMSDDNDLLPWRPPLRSTGACSPPARSKASNRGCLLAKLPAEGRWRQIIYESNLERSTALLLLALLNIWNLWDQPPAVARTDAQGRTAHHVFDYLAEFKGGFRLAIAVNLAARFERLGFARRRPASVQAWRRVLRMRQLL